MVRNRSGSLAQRQEVPSTLGQLNKKCKTWQVLHLILFAPLSPLPRIKSTSLLKKNKRFQNTSSTPPSSPQYWQCYLHTQSFSPFLQLGNKTQAQWIFYMCVVNGAFWLQSIRTLHNGVLTASQCNILSLSKGDVCLPVEPTLLLSCQPSSCLCLKSRVPCHSNLPPLCSQQQPEKISSAPTLFSPLYFKACISSGVGNACSLSPSKIYTRISNHITD